MRIEVKSAKELSTFEKARQDCVVTSSLYSFLNGTKWAPADWTVMVWEDEDLVTNVHIVERTIKVGEQAVRLGGIGNVATKVEWRKRGYARSALATAQNFLRDPLNVDFGMMIATEPMVPRYEKLGWRVAARSMLVDQPDGKTSLGYPVMILPVCRQDWPEGEIDLCGLPW
jgi:predicted acetyltransferase